MLPCLQTLQLELVLLWPNEMFHDTSMERRLYLELLGEEIVRARERVGILHVHVRHAFLHQEAVNLGPWFMHYDQFDAHRERVCEMLRDLNLDFHCDGKDDGLQETKTLSPE